MASLPGRDSPVFAPNGRAYASQFPQGPNTTRLASDGAAPMEVVEVAHDPVRFPSAPSVRFVHAERMDTGRTSVYSSGDDSSRPSSSSSTESRRTTPSQLNAAARDEILRKLKREAVRLRTFQTWTSSVVTPAGLARAGFFYFNDRDRVQCAFCLGIVERWEPMDEPMSEHRRLFPRCPFVIGLPVGNIPMDPVTGREIRPVPTLQLPGGFDVTGIRPREVRPTAEPERSYGVVVLPGHQLRDLGVYKRTPAAMPVFLTLDSRIKSFKSWPRGLAQKPYQLAEAGLYYTGVSDEVKCFQCDGGLRGWEPSDDPWVEHAKFFPTCEHVNLIKGIEWVNAVKERFELSTNVAARQAKAEELMGQEPALSALGNGLDAGDVKRALLVQLEKHGRGFLDLHALMRAAHNYAQERVEYEPRHHDRNVNDADMESGYGSQESGYGSQEIVFSQETPSVAPQEETIQELSSEETSAAVAEHTGALFQVVVETVPGASAGGVGPVPAVEAGSDLAPSTSGSVDRPAEEMDLVCKICMDTKVEVVILPCGHLCACLKCSTSQMSDNCPICRQKVAGYVRVYLS